MRYAVQIQKNLAPHGAPLGGQSYSFLQVDNAADMVSRCPSLTVVYPNTRHFTVTTAVHVGGLFAVLL